MNSPEPGKVARRFVIVGGGTAGWMVAAALARYLRPEHASIRLIESASIGVIGVGEATIPPIRTFLAMLRIDEADFIRNTQGSFKLGIEFVDWARPGHRYMHPFGLFGADIEGVPFHHFYLKGHQLGSADPIEAYSLTARAAREGRFSNVQGAGFPENHWAWAYHFDAIKVAAYLRGYAQRLGVERIEGRVGDVRLRAEDGFIDSLLMTDGRQIEGDFYFDCSGFRGVLINQALGNDYEDWSHWLPCNRALAVPSARNGPVMPHTRATARPGGWQWEIPLQHRTGNGYVYCDANTSDDRAAELLLASLPGKPLAEPRLLSFTTGRRRVFWDKNCLALGLAAGFLEPLESTAIHLVQEGIARFLALFPGEQQSPEGICSYNQIMGSTYEQLRDFLVLHYHATEREDSSFWRHCRSMEIPDSLRRKIRLFRESGACFRSEDDLFSVTSWVAVLLGQGVWPRRYNALADTMTVDQLRKVLERMRARIGETAAKIPPQAEFIERHCKAEGDSVRVA